MNLFGVGSWEVLTILLIALIVAGPKRMLQWAYYAGRMMGQLRMMWRDVMKTVQAELDEAGVDVQLPKDLNRQEIARSANQIVKPFTDQVEKAAQEYQSEIRQVEEEYKQEIKEIDQQVKEASTDPNKQTVLNTKLPEIKKAEVKEPKPEEAKSNGFGTWSSNTNQGEDSA